MAPSANSEEAVIHAKQYDTMDSSDRLAFQDLVEKGGEINRQGLLERIQGARIDFATLIWPTCARLIWPTFTH